MSSRPRITSSTGVRKSQTCSHSRSMYSQPRRSRLASTEARRFFRAFPAALGLLGSVDEEYLVETK